ncbi:hypothetical protein ACEPAG_1488 [Sanghuangporus baumii]
MSSFVSSPKDDFSSKETNTAWSMAESSSTLACKDEFDPYSSYPQTLSLAAPATFSDDGTTIGRSTSLKRASTSTFTTVRSATSLTTVRTRAPLARRSSLREILSKSFTILTTLPRITSARSELAAVQRRFEAVPLYRQTKILNDLLGMTRDELPYQMRKSALKLIHYSFSKVVRDIFSEPVRQQFQKALKELCSDEVSYDLRSDGLDKFNYLVGAGASLSNKVGLLSPVSFKTSAFSDSRSAQSFALEHEDCRFILSMLRGTALVSLKLAACAYLWLSHKMFIEHLYNPVSEAEFKEICIILVDFTQHPLPLDTRRDALDWLWRYEYLQDSDLPDDARLAVAASILEISGYTESNGFLLYQHADSENDYLSGLRRLWWFSTLRSWDLDMKHEKSESVSFAMTIIPTDIFGSESRPQEIRGQGFELIALFSNITQWRDMYDDTTWRVISDAFAEYCLRDAERVNKEIVKRRVESLLARSTSDDGPTSAALTPRKELQVARRMSGVVRAPRYSQVNAAKKVVRQYCTSDTTIEASLENLYLFMLPGECLLIQKDQQEILYERICNYARFHVSRLIAVQAMYALLTIREWLSAISFAKGPPM